MGNFDLYHYAPGKRFQPDRGPANQVRAAPDNVVRTLPNAEVRELGFRRELERTPSRYSAISVAVSTNRACHGGFGFVARPWAPVAILVVVGAAGATSANRWSGSLLAPGFGVTHRLGLLGRRLLVNGCLERGLLYCEVDVTRAEVFEE